MTDLVAPTKRRPMTKARRVRLFLEADGVCCLCEQRIRDGEAWTIEHLIALSLGGKDTDENCRPAHERCRRVKDKQDAAAKAKRDRIVDAGYRGEGKKKSRFPGSKASRFKKRMDGTVIDRETGLPAGGAR